MCVTETSCNKFFKLLDSLLILIKLCLIYRLKSIKKQVELREAELADRAARRHKEREESIYKTRRLNKNKFEELEEDVVLSSDLTGSLRTSKVCCR